MIEGDPTSPETKPETDSSGPAYEPLINLVREIGSAMASNNLSSVDLRYEGLRLSIVANDHSTDSSMPASRDGTEPSREPAAVEAASDPGLHTVTAPMIGTFYVAPAPNEPPFVNPGDSIGEGQTIGIIEAMKIMNEIASDKPGEIVEVIAKNGETVEFGSPLVTIRVHG